MTQKQTIAKIIRTITVPPVQVTALLLLLFFLRREIFLTPLHLLFALLFLMVIPVLAYPLSVLLPRVRATGREGQRKLAFVMSLAGYTGGVIYGLAASVDSQLMLIFWTYFISVAVLIFFNRLLKRRASGHACSITGPLIAAVYFIGWPTLIPCILLFAAIIWSSLCLKRHTVSELVWGGFSAAIAFIVSLLLV